MRMELQGKKVTHDFLSLYNKDSSFQLCDPSPPLSQGIYLKTHDFLQPSERAEKTSGIDVNRTPAGPADHVLPGGIGTYSVGHVSGLGLRAQVKPEQGTCPVSHASSGVGFALWEEPGAKPPAGSKVAGQWPPATFAAARGSAAAAAVGSLSSSRQQGPQERKRFMEAISRSSDDDEEFNKRDGAASHKGELTVRMDRRSSPSTPRSKHSATEQRRRSKINDRFQKLRELIPHSDQKRDKASFLLEVIEYIRFLQEKVQKYETSYPGWNQENAWEKVYFRSIWKNAQSDSQGPIDGSVDHSQTIKNGPAHSGFILSGRFEDNSIPVAPAIVSSSQNPSESDNMTADVSYKTMEIPPAAAVPGSLQPNLYATIGNEAAAAQTQQRLISDGDHFASHLQSQVDCTVSCDMLNEQELTIDEGTISVSSIYSQGLLSSLTQALQSSGVDLSHANISVQINLGKRVGNRRAAMPSFKDHDDPSPANRALDNLRIGSSGEESEHLSKKRRSNDS